MWTGEKWFRIWFNGGVLGWVLSLMAGKNNCRLFKEDCSMQLAGCDCYFLNITIVEWNLNMKMFQRDTASLLHNTLKKYTRNGDCFYIYWWVKSYFLSYLTHTIFMWLSSFVRSFSASFMWLCSGADISCPDFKAVSKFKLTNLVQISKWYLYLSIFSRFQSII